jgi:phosphoenolpyruvate phosphomutase
VRTELAASRAEGLERASVTHILQAMIDRGHPVVAVDVHKGWMEIDTIEDYRRACAEVVR